TPVRMKAQSRGEDLSRNWPVSWLSAQQHRAADNLGSATAGRPSSGSRSGELRTPLRKNGNSEQQNPGRPRGGSGYINREVAAEIYSEYDEVTVRLVDMLEYPEGRVGPDPPCCG